MRQRLTAGDDDEGRAAQYDWVLKPLGERVPKVAALLEDARPDLTAFTAFPKERSAGRSGTTTADVPPVY